MKWHNTTKTDTLERWIDVDGGLIKNQKAEADRLAAEREAARLAAEKEAGAKDGDAFVGDKRDREGNFKTPDISDDQSPNLPWWDDSPPSIGDLIPENPEDPTSGMDIDQEGTPAPTEAARGATPTGGQNPQSKETPISRYPSLTYGLQETHTTVLPFTAYLTAASMDKGTPVQFRIHLNRPVTMIDGPANITAAPADGTYATTKGLYNVPLNGSGQYNNGVNYPATLAVNYSGQEPQWGKWWARIYENYTVLGCEYEIIMENMWSQHGGDVVCAVEDDSYSDTVGATNNIMPLTKYHECIHFKNIKWYRLGNASASNSYRNNMQIIKGTQKPGQIHRNVRNDGDVKTWTQTTTSGAYNTPTLKEAKTFNFWMHPHAAANFTSNTTRPAVNMTINLKYIVQFKDLRLQARYPNTLIAGQNITLESTNDVGTSDVLAKPGAN